VNFKTNKIRDIREFYIAELKNIYPAREASLFLDMIFEQRLNISSIDRALYPDRRISESEMLQVHFDIKELRKFRPIQYIHQVTGFCDLDLFVDERVLIPRPETEELVEWIANENTDCAGIFILDVGTGSGAIALALKQRLPQAQVSGCDLSTEALDVAKINASKTGLVVDFFEMDIMSKTYNSNLPEYDIIVSNPPYVTTSERKIMSRNVLDFEPEAALFVSDDDPLRFYRAVIRYAKTNLKTGGIIFFEINERFGTEVSELLIRNNYQNVRLKKDLFDKDRMISGQKMQRFN
jgi:release factor glutamine methyltransferase